MDIMELGALGELVGGVAVIATLLYLAVQIRQATSVAQGTAEQELMDAVQRISDQIARQPELWQKGLASFVSLRNREQLTFSAMINPWVNVLEQTLRMHGRGLLTQDNVDLYGDICLSFIREPGGREVWERTKPLFFPMSRRYIQRRLDGDVDLPPPVSQLLPWHKVDAEREV